MLDKDSYLYRSVKETAEELVGDYGYADPEKSYCRCVEGAEKLEERLTPEFVSFRLGVSTENQFTQWLWETNDPDLSEVNFHVVNYVPTLGAIDVTGSQFGCKAVRIMEEPPKCWRTIDEVHPPKGIPVGTSEETETFIDSLPHTPSHVFRHLDDHFNPRSGF